MFRVRTLKGNLEDQYFYSEDTDQNDADLEDNSINSTDNSDWE